ncbi:response regulator transcription factor [Streptomyces sp. Z26]|uniref:response regulator n=1 Tax=Streptomyces TaxID=1883 RepID=UPI000EF135C1|nr:response regulator transcription factor [Streptomyces sp. Z26]RLL67343.1 DNA-binding response regulator [Streptomyces sp. Z26]
MTGPVRLVLADDQTVVRAGFRALFDLTDDLVVVAEAGDGRLAVEAVRTTRPDVVLMDIRMPGVDGIEATRRIAADPELDRVRVIMLTTYEVDAYVFEALRHGAAGFLLKDIEPEGLRAAVRTVAAGQSLLAPAVTRGVIEEFARLRAPEAAGAERLAVLTGREREVMALVAAGLANEEIGRALTMSPLTAKTHVSRAMTKLGARDRAQLVILAYETGLVRPGEQR